MPSDITPNGRAVAVQPVQAVQTLQPSALLGFIERASTDPDFSVEKFGALLALYQSERSKQEQDAFNAAMSRVQADLTQVGKDKRNPHLGTRYATLEALDAVARPVYTREGFSVQFGTGTSPREGWVRVTCTVAHSGFSRENALDAPIDYQQTSSGRSSRTAIQALGSTISYCRRVLLMTAFHIVPTDDSDDDDGTAARPQPAQEPRQQAAAREAAYAPPRPPARPQPAQPASQPAPQASQPAPAQPAPAQPAPARPVPVPSGESDRDRINREVPMASAPAGSTPKSRTEIFIDKVEQTLGGIDTVELWDRFWVSPQVKDADLNMPSGPHRDRWERIKLAAMRRIFPEASGEEGDAA